MKLLTYSMRAIQNGGMRVSMASAVLLPISMVAASQMSVLDVVSDLHPHGTRLLSVSSCWDTLGPFRIGTREAVWGADPLEFYGGFANLSVNTNTTFTSSIAQNASVTWSQDRVEVKSVSPDVVIAHFEIDYSGVDWVFMQQVYGWSALQYQAWMRGSVYLHSQTQQNVLVYTSGVLEFSLNQQSFFGGDFFGFNRSAVVVQLKPGCNIFNVRLLRDVRANGGNLPAVIAGSLQFSVVRRMISIDYDHVVVPNLVAGKLISSYMSVPVTNLCRHTIIVTRCESGPLGNDFWDVLHDKVTIVAGQTRPIALRLPSTANRTMLHGKLCFFKTSPTLARVVEEPFDYELQDRGLYEAHKFTFLHPSQAVSYAVLKPPRTRLLRNASRPLMVNLHGAGVETDSELVRTSLDGIPDLEAFVLFPTGMSPWSGDDWHIWGVGDVLAAIKATESWVETAQWNGPAIDTTQILISGHSNGGQGTWFFASHMPDLTLAAAALSGYSSIENYVPYNFWNEADPVVNGILNSARSSYKHELLVSNLVGLPVQQQHGAADDNVPPYHSRLMRELLGVVHGTTSYAELPGAGHYFEGILTTPPLRDFYKRFLYSSATPRPLPSKFSMTSAATNEFGSNFGWSIDQQLSPHYLARIDVEVVRNKITTWHVQPFNVRRLQFQPRHIDHNGTQYVQIDQHHLQFSITSTTDSYVFTNLEDGQWIQELPISSLTERTGSQRGALDAILRSRTAFQLVSSSATFDLAVQASRNFFQYYAADTEILSYDSYNDTLHSSANLVVFCVGNKVPSSELDTFPIIFTQSAIRIRLHGRSDRSLKYQPGMAAVFLRPLKNERLELVIWGYDLDGVRQAARLVPTLTGAGQPDFTILGHQAKWQGVRGTLAMGFLDYAWNVSAGSYLP